MSFSSVNWWAVLACVIFSMISGSIWYNPSTFFKVWWKAIGKSETDPPGGSPMMWVLTVLSSIVESIFMAMLVPALGGASLASGARIGFLVWLGLVAPTSLVNKLFAGRYQAWGIEVGNHLINLVVFGAILGAWH
ncbi:MAG: DUF1761 domain-containing protein [Anaerolineales bacterium]|jgi:hypothetical protein